MFSYLAFLSNSPVFSFLFKMNGSRLETTIMLPLLLHERLALLKSLPLMFNVFGTFLRAANHSCYFNACALRTEGYSKCLKFGLSLFWFVGHRSRRVVSRER